MLHNSRPFKSDDTNSCKILAQRRHYDIIDHLMDNLPASELGRKKMDIPKPDSGVTYKFKSSVRVRLAAYKRLWILGSRGKSW